MRSLWLTPLVITAWAEPALINDAACCPGDAEGRMHRGVLSPWRLISDAIELRHLRRRLPHAHRAWSLASGKQRPETNAEYLVRLRALAREREQLRDRKGNTIRVPAQGERGA
jgi:hypothetical protein